MECEQNYEWQNVIFIQNTIILSSGIDIFRDSNLLDQKKREFILRLKILGRLELKL